MKNRQKKHEKRFFDLFLLKMYFLII